MSQLLQQQAEMQKQILQQLQEEKRARESLERKLASVAGQDPLMNQADSDLREDVWTALRSSKFPRARLKQIAASRAIGFDEVEEIANQLLLERQGTDLDTVEFRTMVDRVKFLEEHCPDEGERLWKLQRLARRYGRTPNQLMEAFSLALINNSPVEPLTLRELKARYGEEPDWLIPGWILRGTTVLMHADGGTGKTLFAYDMIDSLIKGRTWQGYPCQKSKVMIVQLDEPAYATIDRLEMRGIPEDEVFILGDWQASELPRLAKYIEAERPDFVLIDSLTAINRSSCFKENDTEYARPLLHLADLAARFGTTFFVIHHSSVEGRARGSTAIRNSVSEVWQLTHHNQILRELALKVEKTRMGRSPGTYKFVFDPSTFAFSYEGELQGQALMESDAPQQEQIRLWLSEDDRRGTAYHPKEIAEALGLNDASCRRACSEAFSRSLLKRKRAKDGRGHLYFAGPAQLPLGYRDDSVLPETTGTYVESSSAIGGLTPIGADQSPIAGLKTSPSEVSSDLAIGRSAKSKNFGGVQTCENSDRPIADPQEAHHLEFSAAIGVAIGSDRPIAKSEENVIPATKRKEQAQEATVTSPPEIGAKVQYTGSAWQKQKALGKKHLTVESVQENHEGVWLTVNHSSLAIAQTIALSDVKVL